MKIITIIGARPQFRKASVVSMALAKNLGCHGVIFHAGQYEDVSLFGWGASEENTRAITAC